MTQIFGLEFISNPPPPQYFGAEAVLAKINIQKCNIFGYSVKTWAELEEALISFRRNAQGVPTFILISGHGSDGKIALGHNAIRLSDVFRANPGLFRGTWVHLSYCQSLILAEDHRMELVEKYDLYELSGYKRQPVWEESFLLDLEVIKEFIIGNS